jgi:SAM-dependent methyltransferases related to tRNA (uracil-5-)-methyltransferase
MSRRRKVKPKVYEISIESLSNEGRGISHYDDKIIFTRGALPGERVIASRSLSRAKYEEADVVDILEPSPDRIKPKCDVYGVCGGCSFQHLSSKNQIYAKQSWLKSAFMGQAKIEPKKWLEPLQAESWGYRRKARLGVRYVEKKEKVLVGFRERKSSFITVMSRCEVLHPSLGDNLELLGECIGKLSIKMHVPQIEVAIAELDTILILRHLEPMTKGDESILKEYGDKLAITWYTQSGGLETIKPLINSVLLTYSIPDHNINMTFLP